MIRLGLSLAPVLAAAALAAPPSEAFSRLNTCVPQYAYRVVRDYYGQEKLAKYYRDATCQWTIASYAPVPRSKIAARR